MVCFFSGDGKPKSKLLKTHCRALTKRSNHLLTTSIYLLHVFVYVCRQQHQFFGACMNDMDGVCTPLSPLCCRLYRMETYYYSSS